MVQTWRLTSRGQTVSRSRKQVLPLVLHLYRNSPCSLGRHSLSMNMQVGRRSRCSRAKSKAMNKLRRQVL
jgi:hypothetical protein